MADLKNLGKFAASVAAEAESIVASARRQLDDLAKRRRLELQEVERAAGSLLGEPFGELFQRAAVVLVRECRISGPSARMVAAGFRLEGGKAIGTDGRADDEFHLGDLLHSRSGERGHQLEDGYYRAVLALVQIAPPAGVSDAAE